MDGSDLTALAHRVAALGEQVRRDADRMCATDAVHWQSLAARRYREHLAAESARVRAGATALDDAAAALVAHARAVAAGGHPWQPHV